MDEFGAFYKKNKDRLFNYLIRMTGDYHLSGDILQESFTRYLERYRKDPPTLQLLYTIARNAFVDHARRQKRQTVLEDEHEDPSGNQEKRLMIRQEYNRMLSALQTLKEDEREILSLALDGELSYREISEISGITEANVKVKVHRARVKVKEILSQGGK